jgi:uncharacterized membrane protein YcaP (DUF421 family)
MQPEQLQAFDMKRLVIGQVPGLFLLEVAVRAVITYLVLLLAARAMGKRVAGQMSVLELTIIVTLGAAIGVPLESPERGMLPAVIVLTIAVAYQRAIGRATFSSRRAVGLLEGKPAILVRDGALELETMKGAALSRERLFAILRNQRVLQLGQVKRAYLEAGGQLSVYLDDDPRPGLCLLPGQDGKVYEGEFAEGGKRVCRSCANVVDAEPGQTATEGEHDHPAERRCPICHDHDWGPAVRVVPIRELPNTQPFDEHHD